MFKYFYLAIKSLQDILVFLTLISKQSNPLLAFSSISRNLELTKEINRTETVYHDIGEDIESKDFSLKPTDKNSSHFDIYKSCDPLLSKDIISESNQFSNEKFSIYASNHDEGIFNSSEGQQNFVKDTMNVSNFLLSSYPQNFESMDHIHLIEDQPFSAISSKIREISDLSQNYVGNDQGKMISNDLLDSGTGIAKYQTIKNQNSSYYTNGNLVNHKKQILSNLSLYDPNNLDTSNELSLSSYFGNHEKPHPVSECSFLSHEDESSLRNDFVEQSTHTNFTETEPYPFISLDQQSQHKKEFFSYKNKSELTNLTNNDTEVNEFNHRPGLLNNENSSLCDKIEFNNGPVKKRQSFSSEDTYNVERTTNYCLYSENNSVKFKIDPNTKVIQPSVSGSFTTSLMPSWPQKAEISSENRSIQHNDNLKNENMPSMYNDTPTNASFFQNSSFHQPKTSSINTYKHNLRLLKIKKPINKFQTQPKSKKFDPSLLKRWNYISAMDIFFDNPQAVGFCDENKLKNSVSFENSNKDSKAYSDDSVVSSESAQKFYFAKVPQNSNSHIERKKVIDLNPADQDILFEDILDLQEQFETTTDPFSLDSYSKRLDYLMDSDFGENHSNKLHERNFINVTNDQNLNNLLKKEKDIDSKGDQNSEYPEKDVVDLHKEDDISRKNSIYTSQNRHHEDYESKYIKSDDSDHRMRSISKDSELNATLSKIITDEQVLSDRGFTFLNKNISDTKNLNPAIDEQNDFNILNGKLTHSWSSHLDFAKIKKITNFRDKQNNLKCDFKKETHFLLQNTRGCSILSIVFKDLENSNKLNLNKKSIHFNLNKNLQKHESDVFSCLQTRITKKEEDFLNLKEILKILTNVRSVDNKHSDKTISSIMFEYADNIKPESNGSITQLQENSFPDYNTIILHHQFENIYKNYILNKINRLNEFDKINTVKDISMAKDSIIFSSKDTVYLNSKFFNNYISRYYDFFLISQEKFFSRLCDVFLFTINESHDKISMIYDNFLNTEIYQNFIRDTEFFTKELMKKYSQFTQNSRDIDFQNHKSDEKFFKSNNNEFVFHFSNIFFQLNKNFKSLEFLNKIDFSSFLNPENEEIKHSMKDLDKKIAFCCSFSILIRKTILISNVMIKKVMENILRLTEKNQPFLFGMQIFIITHITSFLLQFSNKLYWIFNESIKKQFQDEPLTAMCLDLLLDETDLESKTVDFIFKNLLFTKKTATSFLEIVASYDESSCDVENNFCYFQDKNDIKRLNKLFVNIILHINNTLIRKDLMASFPDYQKLFFSINVYYNQEFFKFHQICRKISNKEMYYMGKKIYHEIKSK